jgi:hypothetical protein
MQLYYQKNLKKNTTLCLLKNNLKDVAKGVAKDVARNV